MNFALGIRSGIVFMTHQTLFFIQAMSGGIKWMGFGDIGQIYVASHRQIVVYCLNYLPEFWRDQRASSIRLELSGADGKSTRLVSMAQDSRFVM